MPRLIFVNRYFFPDHSATSQILSDLAFHLAAGGRDVHVVTSRQIYDDPKAALADCETINGVQVHRVASTQFGRGALLGRSMDYLSFYLSVRRRLAELTRQRDIVIAKTDPPLLSVAAMGIVRRNGGRLVNWLQDIYPETATVLAVPFMKGPVASSLATIRNRSLRRGEATVVVGELMAAKIAPLGAPMARVHVIANWCDDENIRPVAPEQNPLRQKWDLRDRFVLGYSGNLGLAHEYDTLLGAAERLRNDRRFLFLMIGGGRRFEELKSVVNQRALDASFRFMPYQERTALPYSLSAPDGHWLSLNADLEGLIVPSKFYGIVAAAKPVVFIGDTNGEIAQLIRQYSCGAIIAAGDADTLVATLQQWSNAPESVAAMGTRARGMLDARFTRTAGLARWSELLDRLVSASD